MFRAEFMISALLDMMNASRMSFSLRYIASAVAAFASAGRNAGITLPSSAASASPSAAIFLPSAVTSSAEVTFIITTAGESAVMPFRISSEAISVMIDGARTRFVSGSRTSAKAPVRLPSVLFTLPTVTVTSSTVRRQPFA